MTGRSIAARAVAAALLLSGGTPTLSGCASAPAPGPRATAPVATAPAAPDASRLSVRSLALPGAGPSGVLMDYLAYDAAHHHVFVPAGDTGSVDVIDTTTDAITRIEGFATAEIERHGRKRVVGPSSATVGDGVVYVGNRGDSSVCAIDATTLARGACGKLASMPDALAFIAATREVWVTTPRDKSILVLDGATLAVKAKLPLDGEPEGFAVDNERGRFYTNLEDEDRTLAIDVRARKVAATWMPSCGEDGPKGLALDHARNVLVVACSARVEALDAGHDGKVLSKLDVGGGIDDLGYVESRHELYVGAGKAGTLTVARLDDGGVLWVAATVATRPGARNAVATEGGAAYLTDSAGGAILVVTRDVAGH